MIKKAFIHIMAYIIAFVALIVYWRFIKEPKFSDCENTFQKCVFISIRFVFPIMGLALCIYLWNNLLNKISDDFIQIRPRN